MESLEIWSIASSITSIILAILAIVLSGIFFVSGKNSEKSISNFLTEIKVHTEILQKITGKQLDRLTKHVTSKNNYEELPNLLTILAQWQYTMTASIQQTNSKPEEQIDVNDLITCYIALYFYITQTNYWSQLYMPKSDEFDESNEFHITIKRIVDMSNGDFNQIARILGNINEELLKENGIYGLLLETKDVWKDNVKSSSEVFESLETQ